jgi:hypothetical protein
MIISSRRPLQKIPVSTIRGYVFTHVGDYSKTLVPTYKRTHNHSSEDHNFNFNLRCVLSIVKAALLQNKESSISMEPRHYEHTRHHGITSQKTVEFSALFSSKCVNFLVTWQYILPGCHGLT